MTREALFTAFFFVVLALLLYQLYEVFNVFLGPFAWAAVFALVFFPAYRLLLVRIRRPELAALAMTLLVFLLTAVPALTLGGVVIGQAQNFYSLVQEKAASGEARAWIESWRDQPLVGRLMRALPRDIRESIDLTDLGVRGAQTASEYLISQIGGIARNVVGFLVDFTLMLFVLFFFFRDGRTLYFAFRDLLPMEREHKDAIFGHLYETLSAVVQGMTVAAAFQGTLCGVAYGALRLPFALLLSFCSFLAAFIPVGGSAFVWVPAAIYLFVHGLWARAVILLVWGTLVVGLIDNVIRPLVIGGRTKLPTLFLLFAILGGLRAYGVIGIFLGPVLLATIVAFLRIYREEYGDRLDAA